MAPTCGPSIQETEAGGSGAQSPTSPKVSKERKEQRERRGWMRNPSPKCPQQHGDKETMLSEARSFQEHSGKHKASEI